MTIDKRATSYIAENEYTEKEACIAYAAYCTGARESKSIYTEKALKWFKLNMMCRTETEYQDIVSHFIKAMEEEQ